MSVLKSTISEVSRLRTPSCLCAINPPFCMTGHGRRYTSHHKDTCSISRARAYYTLNAENSCLFNTKPWSTRGTAVNHELAPLSLDWLTDGSRSQGRVESILSILDFTDAVFKAWCCLFNSAVEFSPATMNMLYICGNRIYVGCCYWRRSSKLLWGFKPSVGYA